MKKSTILQLDQINHKFYQQTAQDFAASRWQAWPGWKKLLPYFEQKATDQSLINVLDVGCGGGRLARFLHNRLCHPEIDSESPTSVGSSISISYFGLDRSQELLDISTKLTPKQKSSWQVSFAQIDLVQSLLNNTLVADLQKISPTPPDIICLFAVTHHIPSFKVRQRLVANLADFLAPSGLLMISSWQFLNSIELRNKLVDPMTLQIDSADWEENDFIMDWRSSDQVTYRYCHYMNSDEEIAILKTVNLQTIDEFFADGATRNMNHYLVLRKK